MTDGRLLDFKFRVGQWVRFISSPGHLARSTHFLIACRSYNEGHHGAIWNNYLVHAQKAEDDGAVLPDIWVSEWLLEAVENP